MNYRFAYDGNRDLMGMKGEYKDSTTNELTMFWTIQNFDEKRSYTINETSKECLTSLLLPTTSASVCIPGKQRFLIFYFEFHFYFYSYSRNSNLYRIKHNSI